MPHKDQLAALIQSLTPAEKKYFVQFSSQRSDDKSYMKLYYWVLREKKYNADKLSKELKKTKATLAHQKEYLSEILLKALRNYHDKMPEVAIHNAVSEVAILNEKRLFELSNIRLKRAVSKAQACGRNEIIWRSKYDQQIALYPILPITKFLKVCDEAVGDMEKCLDDMKTFTDFYGLSNRIDQIYAVRVANRNEQEDEEVKNMMQHRLLQTKFTEPQFKMMQHELRSTLYQLLRERVKALDQNMKALEIAEKYPLQVQMNAYGYFVKMHGYIIEYLRVTADSDFKGFEKFMQRLPGRYRKLPFDHTYLDNMFNAHSYGYYLTFYFKILSRNKVSEKKVRKFLNDFEKNLPIIQTFVSKQSIVNMLWRAAFIYFLLKDYDSSLALFNKIIRMGNAKTGIEDQYKARIGILIIHAQQNNFSILPHLLETTKRFLKQIKFWRKVEMETFSLLQKLPVLNSPNARKAAFAVLKTKYDNIQNSEGIDKYSLRIFIYPLWVEQNL